MGLPRCSDSVQLQGDEHTGQTLALGKLFYVAEPQSIFCHSLCGILCVQTHIQTSEATRFQSVESRVHHTGCQKLTRRTTRGCLPLCTTCTQRERLRDSLPRHTGSKPTSRTIPRAQSCRQRLYTCPPPTCPTRHQPESVQAAAAAAEHSPVRACPVEAPERLQVGSMYLGSLRYGQAQVARQPRVGAAAMRAQVGARAEHGEERLAVARVAHHRHLRYCAATRQPRTNLSPHSRVLACLFVCVCVCVLRHEQLIPAVAHLLDSRIAAVRGQSVHAASPRLPLL